MDEFVHAPGPEGGAHSVCQCHAGIDVADQLCRALAGVCAFFQKNNLRLLQGRQSMIHTSAGCNSAVHCSTHAPRSIKTPCLKLLPCPSLASSCLLLCFDTSGVMVCDLSECAAPSKAPTTELQTANFRTYILILFDDASAGTGTPQVPKPLPPSQYPKQRSKDMAS